MRDSFCGIKLRPGLPPDTLAIPSAARLWAAPIITNVCEDRYCQGNCKVTSSQAREGSSGALLFQDVRPPHAHFCTSPSSAGRGLVRWMGLEPTRFDPPPSFESEVPSGPNGRRRVYHSATTARQIITQPPPETIDEGCCLRVGCGCYCGGGTT